MFNFKKRNTREIKFNVKARNKIIEAGKLKARLEDMRKETSDESILTDINKRIQLVDSEIDLLVRDAKRENGEPIRTNPKKYNRNNIPNKIENNDSNINTENPLMINGNLIG